MSTVENSFYLSISVSEMLPGDERLAKDEINCYVFLNNDPLQKLILANNDSLARIPINNVDEDKIEFIFKRVNKSEIFGCVSFMSKIFLPYMGKKLSQWITLFESPDDDDFDGRLGVNDEEYPKVLINFGIEAHNNKDNQAEKIYDNMRLSTTPASESKIQQNDNNGLNDKLCTRSSIVVIDTKEYQKSQYETKSSTTIMGMNHQTQSISHSNGKALINILGETPIHNTNSINTSTIKTNYQLSNRMSQIRLFNDKIQNSLENETPFQDSLAIVPITNNNNNHSNMSHHENNITSINIPFLNITNQTFQPEELRYTEIEVRQIIGRYEEKIKLLQMDIQKQKDYENENMKLKNMLDEMILNNEDNQQKSKIQYKQLYEKIRELNEENYALKQRMNIIDSNNLNVGCGSGCVSNRGSSGGHHNSGCAGSNNTTQSQLKFSNVMDNMDHQNSLSQYQYKNNVSITTTLPLIDNGCQDHTKSAIIEEYKLRIIELETLSHDLVKQLQIVEQSYQVEYNKNKQLNLAQNELLANYKKFIDDSYISQSNLEYKIKELEKEKKLYSDRLNTITSDYDQQLIKNKTYEMDIDMLKGINNRLNKELEDQKKNYSNLKYNIEHMLKKKDDEILNVRNAYELLNQQVDDMYRECSQTMKDKQYLTNQVNILLSKDYENAIKNLEERLVNAENFKNALYRSFLDNQHYSTFQCSINTKNTNNVANLNDNLNMNSKNKGNNDDIEIHGYDHEIEQEIIIKLENKIKYLTEQAQIHEEEYHKLKCDYDNLKIRLNQYEELYHKSDYDNEEAFDSKKKTAETLKKEPEEKQDMSFETKQSQVMTWDNEAMIANNTDLCNSQSEMIQRLQFQVEDLKYKLENKKLDKQKLQKETDLEVNTTNGSHGNNADCAFGPVNNSNINGSHANANLTIGGDNTNGANKVNNAGYSSNAVNSGYNSNAANVCNTNSANNNGYINNAINASTAWNVNSHSSSCYNSTAGNAWNGNGLCNAWNSHENLANSTTNLNNPNNTWNTNGINNGSNTIAGNSTTNAWNANNTNNAGSFNNANNAWNANSINNNVNGVNNTGGTSNTNNAWKTNNINNANGVTNANNALNANPVSNASDANDINNVWNTNAVSNANDANNANNANIANNTRNTNAINNTNGTNNTNNAWNINSINNACGTNNASNISSANNASGATNVDNAGNSNSAYGAYGNFNTSNVWNTNSAGNIANNNGTDNALNTNTSNNINNSTNNAIHINNASNSITNNEIPFEPYIPKKNDEIDEYLAEFINRTRPPIRFMHLEEGLYAFENKKVSMRMLNGKVIIRIAGGYIMAEDFIKIWANQEIMKLKMMKNISNQLNDLEMDDLPLDFRKKIIKIEEKEVVYVKDTDSAQKLTDSNHRLMQQQQQHHMVRNSTCSTLGYTKVSPIKSMISRLSPLKRGNATDRNHASSNLKLDNAKALTPVKYESIGKKLLSLEDGDAEALQITNSRKRNNNNPKSPARDKSTLFTKSINNRKNISPLPKKPVSNK